ncbi:MAG TPA: nucleotidyl transferase AbiEii/AbiGii toxin family protein [Verrucomicrobiales bacterium]|nr:nucleotidyl transferase AbiEii/AbiGii toxin family protein [Verrucomicrobiales bacterium]
MTRQRVSLFDQLVDEALKTRGDLAALRPVVEKELLHHDILRELSAAGLLKGLTFIGGTCLRACYGSPRLSENLDFTGGRDFKRSDLIDLGHVLTETLQTRYGLPVKVSEPAKSSGRVTTWKLRVETRPGKKQLPAQRIHIDICALPSHDPRPMMLRNIYGIDLGTSGLILQAQSREEILADTIVALALRENRLKNRDLWDILWLTQRGVDLPAMLIPRKVQDHQRDNTAFARLLEERVAELKTNPACRDDFLREMRRFLPVATVRDTLDQPVYWTVLTQIVEQQSTLALATLK